MKDAVATMGTLLPPDVSGRDAVHVAVFSAISHYPLHPGQDIVAVAFGDGDGDTVVEKGAPTIAIVDPFLNRVVAPGQRFWAYLYPRTITGLSHRWTHPAFPDDPQTVHPVNLPGSKETSEKWLREFCRTADCPGYEITLGEAAKAIDGQGKFYSDDCLHFEGYDAHGDIPDEFWDHVAVVLGRKITGPKPKYFSCAC